ncbi:kinase-like domain-containing protein [Rhizophagus diaphanus]|nr:kinase-like domain-containing protein [Rhizophagus diaphanus] [Rhizophagus sp. MUCL 43196]
MDEKPKNLWKGVDGSKYQRHVTISTIGSTTELTEEIDDKIVYIEDFEKRRQVYGICGECKEPGTGEYWCQSCNAKRFKDNFKNWTGGNKHIDEFIQQSQLNAVHYRNYIEWIPFEKFQNVTYIAEGGFGKIYSAEWPEGNIEYWDIENQKWIRIIKKKVALKSLNNSSDICSDFLNEIKSHLQIYLYDIVQCYGITQDPNNKEYIMVLFYCEIGNLRNYLNKTKNYINYESKIDKLQQIARGLLDIHNAEKVHKDFHSGNILIDDYLLFISDLGMCQPTNIKQSVKEEGIYGVLPYMAPEVLRGYQYTKAADIYSFGIIMNEFLSEEIPFNDIPHDEFLAIQIYYEDGEDIEDIEYSEYSEEDGEEDGEEDDEDSEDILIKRKDEIKDIEDIEDMEYSEYSEDDERRWSNEDKSKSFQTHPQAFYTSRLLNFKNLPNPVNSSGLLTFQFSSDANYTAQSTSDPKLKEICQDTEYNIE